MDIEESTAGVETETVQVLRRAAIGIAAALRRQSVRYGDAGGFIPALQLQRSLNGHGAAHRSEELATKYGDAAFSFAGFLQGNR